MTDAVANLSQSFSHEKSVTCSFRGYPDFQVSWNYGTRNENKTIYPDLEGSIFHYRVVSTKTSPWIEKTSTLYISLLEYLGPTSITCFSENIYQNSSMEFQVNPSIYNFFSIKTWNFFNALCAYRDKFWRKPFVHDISEQWRKKFFGNSHLLRSIW